MLDQRLVVVEAHRTSDTPDGVHERLTRREVAFQLSALMPPKAFIC
jgi:hypothetical protein